MVAWLLSQFASYSFLVWLLFLSTTVVASYFGGGWGVIAGQAAISLVVLWLDVRWIRSEMAAPGWDGVPDMDLVFGLGVLLRVLLINAVLLPLAVLTICLTRRHSRPATDTVAPTV